jgi:hypothetical protein
MPTCKKCHKDVPSTYVSTTFVATHNEVGEIVRINRYGDKECAAIDAPAYHVPETLFVESYDSNGKMDGVTQIKNPDYPDSVKQRKTEWLTIEGRLKRNPLLSVIKNFKDICNGCLSKEIDKMSQLVKQP